MYYWHTATIVEALRRIPDVERILVQDPGGDVDSENLVVYVKGTDERLFISGFNVEQPDPIVKGACDVEYIELTDGVDYRGGLNSSSTATTAMVFTRVRQYFVDKGAEVVDTHKDFF